MPSHSRCIDYISKCSCRSPRHWWLKRLLFQAGFKNEEAIEDLFKAAGQLFKAEEEVRLEKSGKLMGDIDSPILHIAPGTIAQGRVNITGGQKKDVKKIVEEAYGSVKTPEK